MSTEPALTCDATENHPAPADEPLEGDSGEGPLDPDWRTPHG